MNERLSPGSWRLQPSPDPSLPGPNRQVPLTSGACPPCLTPGTVCFAESFRWLACGCLLYFSCRWQTACFPPSPRHPTLRVVWKADAAGQNKSLAAELPVCRPLLSNPSPDNIFAKYPLTPPSSGTLPACLPLVWSPQRFPHPHPHRNSCFSHGAGRQFQRAILFVSGGDCCFGLRLLLCPHPLFCCNMSI